MKIWKKNFNMLVVWFVFGVISGPFGIVIHEAGHYAAAQFVGYENSTLRYASMNRGESPDEVELDWKRGVISSGGPFITMILSAACCIYFSMHGKARIVRAIGLSIPLRNISSLVAIVFLLLGNEPKGNDEVKIATFFDISPFIPLILSLLVIGITWYYLIKTMESTNKWKKVLSIFLGIALGNVLWLQVIGPILLP